MTNRPKLLIGVLGTHTEVGKTFVLTKWLDYLRRKGLRVGARKPVQSFDAGNSDTDATRLAAATGEDERLVCPPHRSYPVALAPPMAADRLQRPRIDLSDLLAELRWTTHLDVGAIETVGGPRSPLYHDGDSIDLLLRAEVDRILLVADAGLGSLNAVRLSLASIGPVKPIVYLNRYDRDDELHRQNRLWLKEKYGVNSFVSVDALPLG